MAKPSPSALVEPSDPAVRVFYVDCLRALDEAGLAYVVGGGYAMAYYTGIRRPTKDLDIFVRPEDHRRIMEVLGKRGYRTEYYYPFWIAKALQGEAFVDILYNSGNGICCVDDEWIDNAEEMEVLGYRTRLIPPEEQLWSKAFVQDRDRYDGADVAHLILARGEQFDWARLVRRFIGHERVLLSHLILFGYVYPSERHVIPEWVMKHLHQSVENEPPLGERLCRGTNIAQKGYLADVHELGYADGRLKPHGALTLSELHQLPES